MEGHVKALGILHIVFGALGVIGALVVLLIFGGAAAIVDMTRAAGTTVHTGRVVTMHAAPGNEDLFSLHVNFLKGRPVIRGKLINHTLLL